MKVSCYIECGQHIMFHNFECDAIGTLMVVIFGSSRVFALGSPFFDNSLNFNFFFFFTSSVMD